MEKNFTFAPLITEIEIKHRIDELAEQIAKEFGDEEVILVAILKGSFIFTADLLRSLYQYNVHPQMDFLRASSYGHSEVSSGTVKITLGTTIPLNGKNILLVDDICDSGRTLKSIEATMKEYGAIKVKTCVLMDKPSRREVEYVPNFIGFEIPDKFVIGYGLDYAEKYRDIPYIAVVQHN